MCELGGILPDRDLQPVGAVLHGQLQPVSTTDAREMGSTFCLALFQCRELEGAQVREWNGEENREQENGLIFLTRMACHRDVWTPLRIKATRNWSFLFLDLLFASNIIYDLQLVVDTVSILAKRDIVSSFLLRISVSCMFVAVLELLSAVLMQLEPPERLTAN